MITAVAIDDEPLPLEIIEEYCAAIDFIKLEKTFTQTEEAKKYLKNYPVDLIFLDINMPSISGIDFYKGLKQETMVIFTTAHAQYAVEGFELSAVDYLLKPFSFERFSVAVNKANDFIKFLHGKPSSEEKSLFIRSEYSLVKISISEILYIEGLADYLKIHLENGKMHLTRMTMKGVLAKLSEKEFIRVHRSFIVPLQKIEAVRNKTITLQGSKEIPVGASYEEHFFKHLKAEN